MKSKIIFIVLVLLFLADANCFAQIDSVQYNFGFDFTEGIYLTFEEFKANDPAIKMKNVIIKMPENPYDFNVKLSFRLIKYDDKDGDRKELKLKEIWGLCYDDEIYISYHNKLSGLLKIGSISYFVENYIGMTPSVDLSQNTGPLVSSSNLKKLLDFKTGKIYSYSTDNFSKILKHDPDLFVEFEEINNKKQKMRLLFSFLMKYNERNSIYFPKNNDSVFDPDNASEVKFE